MIGISILGATGSIGRSTLDVIARHPDKYTVIALTAHTDVTGLTQQCQRYQPRLAVMADAASAEQLALKLKQCAPDTEVLSGAAGLAAAAAHPAADQVMAAIVGAVGLAPTLAAVQAGKRVLLANKEALVMAGDLFMTAVQKHQAQIIPIDSEHNAIFQCLPATYNAAELTACGVERILLTASGGPFLNRAFDTLVEATPEEACAHPKWKMGRKISVDSASLMNKGLEVIEAHYLFQADPQQIEVVVHPQSIVHSLVAYQDGSVLAQLGNPDMRTPIAHAMAWPERHTSGVAPLDLTDIARLDFQTPDQQRFPCLGLAYTAIAAGGTAPAILNAANEVAVAHFLQGRLPFTAIPQVIEASLTALAGSEPTPTLTELFAIDQQARHHAEQVITQWLP